MIVCFESFYWLMDNLPKISNGGYMRGEDEYLTYIIEGKQT